MVFSFRVRFRLPPDEGLGVDSPTFEILSSEPGRAVTLRAYTEGQPIRDARDLVLRGDSWPTEADARDAGKACADALMLSLVRMGIGADFGSRSPSSVITKYGLAMLEKQLGRRVLQDGHGVMVFESDPKPYFASMGPVSLVVTRGADDFRAIFESAVQRPSSLSNRERLAIDLYNSSFFETSVDARLLTLVTAIEALLDPASRSGETRRHVEALIQSTKESTWITSADKNSLLGSLKWLKNESIGRTGRRLATERLGDRQYMNLSGADFFSHCYDMRSRLVHGATSRPNRDQVSLAVSELKTFVADLLCGSLPRR